MSKEAALRAMREARYAARTAQPVGAAPPPRTAPPSLRRSAAATATPTSAPTVSSDALCGHRSMNGRTCTREQGHEAKSHRYG